MYQLIVSWKNEHFDYDFNWLWTRIHLWPYSQICSFCWLPEYRYQIPSTIFYASNLIQVLERQFAPLCCLMDFESSLELTISQESICETIVKSCYQFKILVRFTKYASWCNENTICIRLQPQAHLVVFIQNRNEWVSCKCKIWSSETNGYSTSNSQSPTALETLGAK